MSNLTSTSLSWITSPNGFRMCCTCAVASQGVGGLTSYRKWSPLPKCICYFVKHAGISLLNFFFSNETASLDPTPKLFFRIRHCTCILQKWIQWVKLNVFYECTIVTLFDLSFRLKLFFLEVRQFLVVSSLRVYYDDFIENLTHSYSNDICYKCKLFFTFYLFFF